MYDCIAPWRILIEFTGYIGCTHDVSWWLPAMWWEESGHQSRETPSHRAGFWQTGPWRKPPPKTQKHWWTWQTFTYLMQQSDQLSDLSLTMTLWVETSEELFRSSGITMKRNSVTTVSTDTWKMLGHVFGHWFSCVTMSQRDTFYFVLEIVKFKNVQFHCLSVLQYFLWNFFQKFMGSKIMQLTQCRKTSINKNILRCIQCKFHMFRL